MVFFNRTGSDKVIAMRWKDATWSGGGPVQWTEVTSSQFSHEAEGLSIVRALLPDLDPFLAWSNFEFRDSHGRWHEVDLLVLGQRRLHLVELKYYSGVLRGNDHTWLRVGHRAEDSPLKLARRKAQRLASTLQDGLLEWASERGTRIPDVREAVPYIQECVFLHHPDLRCELPPGSRIDLFGLDARQRVSLLPGISQRLLEPPAPGQVVTAARAKIIAEVMTRLGVHRRQREAGSWIIDDEPLGEGEEGETWQEWPAFHRVATTNRARIRFLVTPVGSTAARRARLRRIAEHEYRVMARLTHENLLRPIDIVDGDLGVGLVYPRDERYQRLDLWLAGTSTGISVGDQLDVLRQVADAVLYAHSNRVVHRGLSPHAVWIRRRDADGKIHVLVGDWQLAGSTGADSLTGSSGGITGLFGTGEQAERLAAATQGRLSHGDLAGRFADAFQAPEGIFTDRTDRVRLDVFALGALGYYIMTGYPAAATRAGLRERLRRENGLDLAADLSQVAAPMRDLVLGATRPQVSERLPDVRAFLAGLDQAERVLLAPDDEEVTDILEASSGTIVDGRYRLERRLGSGSTAVGMLVTDLAPCPGSPGSAGSPISGQEAQPPQCVLKVAIDDSAAARLAGEAEVLRSLDDPRIVRILEGPKKIGGRTALVLDRAGDQTLAEVLRERERLSLDMQERYGTDLLEVLVVLDRAGVDHRDIKPSNLGVREDRGTRAKHLVLFDFSLSRAGATAVTAGTQNYLDPFLDDPGRGRFDSAAERYSAAVVLFEMATGSLPRFGDGLSDPASLSDEATIDRELFAPPVADRLTVFFRRALARRAADRFDTAADMLAAWQGAFAPVPRSLPDNADESAAEAGPETQLAQAGLSVRALSALEPYGVHTVADLLAVDPVRLNRMSGVADMTRREIKSRAAQWRKQFAAPARGRGLDRPPVGRLTMHDPLAAAELLVERAGSARAQARRALASLLTGLDQRVTPFAPYGELAAVLGVTTQRIAQQAGALQETWAGDETSRVLLDGLAATAAEALAELDGVATAAELTAVILSALAPPNTERDVTQVTAGLLRVAFDRIRALSEADEDAAQLAFRRRDGKIALLATSQALLDPVEALGRKADELMARAEAADERLVQGQRAVPQLQAAWMRSAGSDDQAPQPPGPDRLLRLAAALSQTAALSGARDLHPRDLDVRVALRDALTGAASLLELTAKEIRDRFRARFPALPPLPDRPRLDELLDEAGLELRYDEQARAFRQPSRSGDTSKLSSRAPTVMAEPRMDLVAGGREGHRLAESAQSRSFLALGVDSRFLTRAVDVLTRDYGALELDLTALLIQAMRTQADAVGLPWPTVTAADAAPPGSREAQGLATLVQRSLPAIDAAIDAALTAAPEGTRPVLLTDAATLARYGHLNVFADRADLATRRPQAIWILVPQLDGNRGAVLDGRPLPLAAPGQFLRLDADWLGRPAAAHAGGTA
jgi:serine/threonine protein kinase